MTKELKKLMEEEDVVATGKYAKNILSFADRELKKSKLSKTDRKIAIERAINMLKGYKKSV